MTEHLSEAMARTASHSLQHLAFLFASPKEPGPASGAPDAVGARIRFSGPFSGDLIISVSPRLLPELAANMLGVDDEEAPPIDHQHDSLKELLNVVCGNLLPEIAGSEVTFELQAPELLSPGSLDRILRERRPTATAGLVLDEGEADLVLLTEPGWEGALPGSGERKNRGRC